MKRALRISLSLLIISIHINGDIYCQIQNLRQYSLTHVELGASINIPYDGRFQTNSVGKGVILPSFVLGIEHERKFFSEALRWCFGAHLMGERFRTELIEYSRIHHSGRIDTLSILRGGLQHSAYVINIPFSIGYRFGRNGAKLFSIGIAYNTYVSGQRSEYSYVATRLGRYIPGGNPPFIKLPSPNQESSMVYFINKEALLLSASLVFDRIAILGSHRFAVKMEVMNNLLYPSHSLLIHRLNVLLLYRV